MVEKDSKGGMECNSVIPRSSREVQGGGEGFKVILRYTVTWKLVWDIQDSVSKDRVGCE